MPNGDYTPVSSLAVVSLAAGLCSLLGFLLLPVSIIGAVALITGILALFGIRKYGFKGKHLAVAGLAMSLVGLLVPATWVYYAIQHEALPGHTRVDFRELMRSGRPRFDEYVGQPICLTGFVLSERNRKLTQFKFSPDVATGFSQPDDWIVVEIPDKWTWDEGRIVVSGALVKIDDPSLDQPQYILQAKAVRPAANRLSLVTVSSGGGGC